MKKRSADGITGSGGSKLRRIMEAPIRVLCRARDMYVNSMTGLAEKASYAGVAGYPGGAAVGVPGSYRFYASRVAGSGGGDLEELVRAASQSAAAGAAVPRSQSAGMARIDEDESCDFGPLCPPRSRSCPVAKKSAVGMIGA